jgi:DNA repair photolyase
VVRNLDLLGPMAADGLAAVMMSVTTLDPRIAMTMEPRASAPAKRIAAIGALRQAGVPVFLSLSPVVPAITDHEIEAIVAAAADAGAIGAFSLMVRLPHEVSPIFRDWLDAHFPDRKDKVMNLIREARGGRDNDPDFFTRMKPKGAYAAMLKARFDAACRKHGLTSKGIPLRTDLFLKPGGEQLSLL